MCGILKKSSAPNSNKNENDLLAAMHEPEWTRSAFWRTWQIEIKTLNEMDNAPTKSPSDLSASPHLTSGASSTVYVFVYFRLNDFPCAWFWAWMISFIFKNMHIEHVLLQATFAFRSSGGMRNERQHLCLAIEITQRFSATHPPNLWRNNNEVGRNIAASVLWCNTCIVRWPAHLWTRIYF